ncbi:MAG: acyl carrier protein [Candidatus Odinarchaeia archaeon]
MIVEEKVKQIIQEQLGIKMELINLSSEIKYELGADELDFADILCEIEEVFGMVISSLDEESFVTVKNIVEYVNEQKGK